ncbi:mannosyl-glycoendo-beta-N-acetylglucosamidase domain protein, possible enterotoxin [[Clostridium] bifermentans ATCC 638]|uniref:Mannosyl-glycoendo-beta-N-acetylglucosamidase domain protein, possible enterotoxin n=1 Tax=Paraclostridium bifermentans ATCC 638 = DSM 14991 TaxID=1233171 RepID=T4VLQ8_PARBF|nr:beta- N-acetylglucosaminidase [Paraclostridium bifermentans]EQK42070.1 mannosyl-glycoendo-beta-N-acetylglucosamidase domain protein, possible enterotoxin [[Clostridium] bifermentans ATCC 638] [Paraclostridium bifermentans ATCC 638 = DSM 14991]RIZ58829.1 beta- N-acetylglucosaminidase [Paraclostridium bifermentans]UAG18935.1 beta- N-acetylglucosaminidase [Paraclostridium bifermentans]
MNKKIAIATLAFMPLTATNVFASGQEGIVTAPSLNVRSEPSTGSSFLFSIKQNEKVTILESQDGWYKIKAGNGNSGWASSEYIKTDLNQNNQSESKRTVTADVLNMRSGASTSYRTIAKIKKGTEVELISESNGWSKIKYEGRIGYASSEFLSNENNIKPSEKPSTNQNTDANSNNNTNETKTIGKTKVVTATSLNVRSGPSTSNGVIGSLKQNDKVEVISESNGWSKVKFSVKEGYVSSAYLKDSNGGNTGGSENPNPTPGKTKVVTATSLNVRSGPSTSNSVIGSLKQNDKVEVISESNGWSKVKFSGKEGYVSSTYLKDADGGNTGGGSETPNPTPGKTKVVTATSLNVRSGPSTSNSVIASLKQNDKVEVISESNGWSKVKFSVKEGYVSSTYLKDADGGNTGGGSETPSTANTKTVLATSLNVRSGPSTSNSVIGSLKQNDKVEVISESNGWSKVKFSGKEGYVSSIYLKDSDSGNTGGGSETPNPSNNKIVTATSLNVRSGPATSNSVIGSLRQNEVVEVISESNGWSKIKFNGKEGYVSSDYLKDYSGGSTGGGGSSEVVDGATVNNTPVSYTLTQHINQQVTKGNGNMIASRGFVQASRSDIEHYINPSNFTGSKSSMLQFLRLDSYKGGITASELNGYLNSLSPTSGGSNVFYNQGQAFINAAQKHNIDLVYLVGHSMLETGYGRSTLAQGQVLTSYQGKPLPQPVKVYNFFGIGAFDGTANLSGAEAAYKNGWTTVEKTIDGSAKWLSSNYIHSSKYGQNTLYKMRWSYENLWHQYATDVNWANAISGVMNKLVGMYDTTSNLVYEVPVHKK